VLRSLSTFDVVRGPARPRSPRGLGSGRPRRV